jgi:hypothetical protein
MLLLLPQPLVPKHLHEVLLHRRDGVLLKRRVLRVEWNREVYDLLASWNSIMNIELSCVVRITWGSPGKTGAVSEFRRLLITIN